MSRSAGSLANSLLKLSYNKLPEAQQVMYTSTTRIFTDPSHPLYLATLRRAASFDPNRLYFKLSWHPTSKKKAVVTSWAVRRVREALRQELQIRGFAMTGEALPQSDSRSGERKALPTYLAGTANIKVAPDDRILKVGFDEVKAAASAVVDSIQYLHTKSPRDTPKSSPHRSVRISQASIPLRNGTRSLNMGRNPAFRR